MSQRVAVVSAWAVVLTGSIEAPPEARAEWIEHRKLLGSDTDGGDELGEVLALDGDRLVAAARNKEFGGRVYIFERNAGGPERWGEVAYLPKPPEVQDLFGDTLDINGDRLIVGTSQDDDRAYIYDRQPDGQWLEVAELTEPPDPKGGDNFADSVAVVGDRVFVGSRLYDFSRGAVWVFERNAGGLGNWGMTARLTSGQITQWLGLAIAADGVRVLAGAEATWLPLTASASGEADLGSNAGVAVVFERDEASGEWVALPRLKSSDTGASDRFGGAVAISGDRLLIGAYTFGDGGDECFECGQAYVFERNESGAWREVARLRPAVDTWRFGSSVALDGDRAIVSPYNPGEPEESGVWVYERQEDGEWLEVARLNAADQARADEYGSDISLDGATVAVGSRLDDDRGGSSGAVYVFLWRDVQLTLTGACPGEVTLELRGATARAPVALLAGLEGESVIPSGSCAGTEIGLDLPRLLGTARTDQQGSATFTRTLGPGACGHDLQAIDLPTCALSPVVPIP